MHRLLLVMAFLFIAAATEPRNVIDHWMMKGQGPTVYMTKAITLSASWQLEWEARGTFKVDLLDENGQLIEELALQNEGGLGLSKEGRQGKFVLRFEATAPWAAQVTVAAETPLP